MSDTSGTFGGWSDRLTYLLAEGQLLVFGVLLSLGAALVIFRPSLPGVPPIVVGWFAVLLLFGPALFAFFVVFIQRLRKRRMVEVHHVDGRQDIAKQYYVSPEIWQEKTVDGASPYPINGGSAWGVQEFEHLEDVDELRVKGVYLSECEDTKIWTIKSHYKAIYEKLTESHIALSIMRDSVNELGADIQRRVLTRAAEAREKGTMIDESAVKDVFESFENDIGGTDENDLPTVEFEEIAEEATDGAVGMGDTSGGVEQGAVADD